MQIDLPSRPLSLERVRVMGILNVTPDSFYDHGQYFDGTRALQRAREMVAEGADILDIGGEKAGPGAPVTLDEELDRVLPPIQAIRREFDVPISVDTLKPEVARAAIDAGADIINSIGGFSDPQLRQVARETGAAVIIMHIQGVPRVANPRPRYSDVVAEVAGFLAERSALCEAEGISRTRIMIDPGPGFGKTSEHDLILLRHLERITSLPYPTVLAVSRKKFIGDVLGVEPAGRLEGSLAIASWGVMRGVRIVRTHDVRATWRVCRMTEAVFHPEFVEA